MSLCSHGPNSYSVGHRYWSIWSMSAVEALARLRYNSPIEINKQFRWNTNSFWNYIWVAPTDKAPRFHILIKNQIMTAFVHLWTLWNSIHFTYHSSWLPFANIFPKKMKYNSKIPLISISYHTAANQKKKIIYSNPLTTDNLRPCQSCHKLLLCPYTSAVLRHLY